MTRCVSLSELAADGIQLRPAEAAALVAELCRQYARGETRGIPSSDLIRINRDGGVVAQGPMTGDDEGVARAGHLLNDLIPDADAPAAYRASGGLRLVIARALGILDLPPYSGLDEFRGALVRFAGPDPVATLRGLFERWEPALVPSGPQPVTALPPSIPQGMARIQAPVPSRDRSRHFSSVPALVVAALLGIGAIGIAVGSAQQDRPAPFEASDANRLTPQPPVVEPERSAPVRAARKVTSSAPMASAFAGRPSATRPRARRAQQPRLAAAHERRREAATERRHEAAPEPHREAAPEPRSEAAPEPSREAARRPSFFKRELFRIVFK